MTPKKVLYLSYDGMTDALGQSQVLPYLIGLSALGYRFWLISFEKAERFAALHQVIEQKCQQAHIVWLPQIYHKRPPVLSTLYDLLTMYRVSAKLLTTEKIAIVHCRSYISALIGRVLLRRFGVAFLFDMRGFWADERTEGGIWNANHLLYNLMYRFFKQQEIRFLDEAHHTVALTQQAVNIIKSWQLKRADIPITVIPCCVDTQLFSPDNCHDQQIQDLRQTLGIGKKDFVLTYVGSLGTWYMLPEMLDFFKILQSHIPTAHLLILNHHPDEQQLAKVAAQERQLTQVHLHGVPYHQMPAYIALSDWGLFFIKPLFSKQASSPTKQGEMLAMGIPIVCNAGIGDTDAIIQSSQTGIVVAQCTPDAYHAAAKQLASNWRPDAARVRATALQYFSLEEGIRSYAQVYEQFDTK